MSETLPKIWFSRLRLLALFFIFIMYVLFTTGPSESQQCLNLLDIAASEKNRREIIDFANKLASRESIKTINNKMDWIISYPELIDKSIYDEMPLLANNETFNIGFLGKNIDYTDLSQSDIEAVHIGHGLRQYILIDVDNDSEYAMNLSSGIKAKYDNLVVVCRQFKG